jgi:integrase
MCKEAGFDGFFTNHSLRATAATRLYAAGVDEQLMAGKTGHRSSAIRNYKRTSEEQLQSVSNLIQKPTTMSPLEPKKVKPK